MTIMNLQIPEFKMRASDAARIHVGTSGWSYRHWVRRFYPAGLPEADWLKFYADRFRTVEINNSFYRLPERRTLTGWAKTVPPQFVFAVKASRYITHMKKLKDPKRATRAFLKRIATLGDRLGPIVFQLPPRWRVDAKRLDAFLRSLSCDFRYAFEFRDHSWINDDVLDALSRHRAAFCVYELDGYLSPKAVTADFIYVRLHGPGGPYRGDYNIRTLSGWAGAFAAWAAHGHEVFCYFDNDQRAFAVHNAARLREMVGG